MRCLTRDGEAFKIPMRYRLSALVGCLLSVGLAWLGRRRRPTLEGRLNLRGLRAPVEVLRDTWGIPHIYASNDRDALFAQGYVHAQDRLWQMDFNRRLVAGRLAEVLGSLALPLDRWMRILTLRRVAEQEVFLLGAAARVELEAYADGINAFIRQGRLPIEFTLLRYKPGMWSLADSLSWVKLIAWALSVNWETELLRAHLIARLGAEHVAELEPAYRECWPRIVPPGSDAAGADSWLVSPAQRGLGSNNWVVNGTRTTSGHPLLANDMHLPMLIPSIWYENHLVGDGLNVTGVTFPGIPGVVAGHNQYVAWGFTNGFPDVQDLYIEHVRRSNDGRVQVEFNGEWYEAQVLHEMIRVKGGHSYSQEVVITRHGPIIIELCPEFAGEQPLALRWTALEPDRMIEALFAVNRAQNCHQVREGLRHWSAPVQNVVYADTQGNIGYSFPGRVPIRARGNGQLPVPGWTDEYEWLGYIPFDELPHVYNPAQGYIATANNRVVGDDYPYYLGRETMMGVRAQRIVELITSRDKLDVAFMQRMQFDQLSHTAQVIASYLGQLAVEEDELADVVRMMRDWDGQLAAESPAAAVYEVFVRQIIPLMLTAKLNSTPQRETGSTAPALDAANLASRYAGRGPTAPLVAERSLFGERALEWLQQSLADPSSHWFDLGQGERRDEVLRLALRRTVDYLKERLGPGIDTWAWGKLHCLLYRHTLGELDVLAPFFNRGPFPLGGDGTTLWATLTNTHDLDTSNVVGPPFRMIIDLGDWRNSLGLLAPGQSGDPTSPHYDDQVQAWFDGTYHPMLFTRREVEAAARYRLRLDPAA